MAKLLIESDKKSIISTVKNVSLLGKSLSRTSITKMAQNSIFNYPHIISAAIPTNEAMTILKQSEYALSNFVLAAISRRNSVNIDKYGNIENYLANIHNNSDINPNFMGIGVVSDGEVSQDSYIQARITHVEDADGMFSTIDKEQMALESLNAMDPIGMLDTGRLNDLYRPYDHTKAEIIDALENMKTAALEAKGDIKKKIKENVDVEDYVKNASKAQRAERNVGKIFKSEHKEEYEVPIKDSRGRYQYVTDKKGHRIPMTDAKGNIIFNKDGTPKYKYKTETKTRTKLGMNFHGGYREGVNAPSYVDTSKRQLSTMEPTLLNVTLSCYGKDLGNWSQNIILGVKALARVVRSELMVNNMVSAAVGSNGAFAFIKLAENELKTALFMFGPLKSLKESKEAALAGLNSDKFMDMVKKRKMFNSLQSLKGAPVPPNMNIIMTTHEVESVSQLTGVDLLNAKQARKILDRYYILSFGVYDTETKEYRVMYDNDLDWQYHTLYSMQSTASGKTYMEINNKLDADAKGLKLGR